MQDCLVYITKNGYTQDGNVWWTYLFGVLPCVEVKCGLCKKGYLAFSVRPGSRSYRWQWSVVVSTCQPYHQRVLLLSASATTCSTISDQGCCSRSSSSNDSQPSRLLQQSGCWSTYWPNVTFTDSFTCGRSTCARPAWSCSSVSSHAWHAPLVEFPAACHVQLLCLLTVSARSGTRLPVALCTLLTSVPGRPLLRSADANKLLVSRSCVASFGLRSFSSSGPTAWNDIPAHLRNLDLSLKWL